jgi:hypothetical protein
MDPKEGCDIFLRNIDLFLTNYTPLHLAGYNYSNDISVKNNNRLKDVKLAANL